MHDYSAFTIEDLVRDPYFRNSILNPDPESNVFWESWVAIAPDHRERYEKARIMVITLHQRYHTQLPHEQVLHRVEQLVGKLNESESTPKKVKPLRISYWWRVAAVLVACFGLLWWSSDEAWKSLYRRNDSRPTSPVSHALVAKHNNTQHHQTLVLSDSSVVTLFPGSSLNFPEKFTGESRKVTLVGDAFFEVTPRSKPFLVYAGETVTRVLGTRFRVTAFPKDDLVKVGVQSGKVAVHRSSEFDLPKTAKSPSGSGIVLTAREQVVFNRVNLQLEKAALKDLERGSQQTDAREQTFVDTPVTDVFKELESIYGIEIEFDETVFANCRIITSFRGETLLERINSICQAIDATYTPMRGGVVISGSGCSAFTPDK
ncbi:hypothetical protein GCM10027347_50230 [Larkinella harenae]